ncbi:MAG: hypothetical protein ABI947_01640 [Chloroflexota bacterium]
MSVPVSTTQEVLSRPSDTTRDDRIYRETRWLCAIIVPFLIAAFYILYLRPTETKELFAWPIKPPMSARMLAAAYAGGIFFFTRAFFARRWHHITLGFLPVTAFASAMGIATFLHWDKFTHDHISFVTWVALYVTTPFLVVATWLRNRQTDPGTPEEKDIILSQPIRYLVGAIGIITIVNGIVLFLQPDFMVGIWGWTLTPLTARVLGGMFALPGVVGLGIAVDPRWSAARIILQSQIFSIIFILLAVVLSWNDFDQTKLATWLFVGGMALLVVILPALYFYVEYRLQKGSSTT